MLRIDTKTGRQSLKPRREPYWMRLSKGFYVGFRRTDTGSETWLTRVWLGSGYRFCALELAGDFESARKDAEVWRDRVLGGGNSRCQTVSDACRSYLLSVASSRPKTAKDAEGRFCRLVFNAQIGSIRLDQLKVSHVRGWLEAQLSSNQTEDNLRKARASANRNLSALKAALNMAYADQQIDKNNAWSIVKPFKGTNVGRGGEAFVERSVRQRYLDEAPYDLSCLMRACLLTGARPGEVAALEARDFNRTLKTLTFRKSKQMRQREVPLSSDAAIFFDQMSRAAIGTGKLLRCADGSSWTKDKWKVSLRKLVEGWGLPVIRLYDLRHTAISEMLMAGVDSFAVAHYTGTSVRMIENTYGHLSREGLRASISQVAFV